MPHAKVPSISVSNDSPDRQGSDARGRTMSDEGLAPVTASDLQRSLSRDSSRGRTSTKDKIKGMFSRSRSPSPYARSQPRSPSPKRLGSGSSAERLAASESEQLSDSDEDAKGKRKIGGIVPSNAFVDSDDDLTLVEDDSLDVDDDDDDELDHALLANTEANMASYSDASSFLAASQPSLVPEPGYSMTFEGEGPNLVSHGTAPLQSKPSVDKFADGRPKPRRQRTLLREGHAEVKQSRPEFKRNRCSIVLTHGDFEQAQEDSKRPRLYLVASDLSVESEYAIEWAIGTVLRNGDECMIVSVIETESKLDSENQSDKTHKIRCQQDRQRQALKLAKIATSLLERTRLNVQITCQAVHAKNSRHMLIDMIDFLEPTMVIIGSRGLAKLKGMLLGSVSNYLIQKSSVPVMVARRRLRRPQVVHKKMSTLNHQARVSLAEAQVEKDANTGTVTSQSDAEAEEASARPSEEGGMYEAELSENVSSVSLEGAR
ncbi:uncharacterized protein L969DRAFT_91365 [Mixia osmundae IAM 14324]|uniref:UspA domain-containing protein n=1 Tax=Mixia osmundae (strain CBS 9802 / IAM 14324 / JCM 22182 / KY 12970) TaxID=764103 RepID=G7E7A4_MIXOS|nr:uncharacterized protein L969DRAFT_91365 [Mixia osmundae IAM 14324]KEI41893.1 hypothetical protein L969DRAFT_91365 [Mixia osmundae IAM 14324]GAA98714.1 hypothetical protein E5Q_05402 [Mixia osmundae IAM 14324]